MVQVSPLDHVAPPWAGPQHPAQLHQTIHSDLQRDQLVFARQRQRQRLPAREV
jgi:hypothetical protein